MNAQVHELLTREAVPFEVIEHRDVYTAQERAAAAHISGRLVAKVVVVRDGEWHAMVVLPAAGRVDLPALRQATGRPGLELAGETELARLFPDCDVGAMPPFGRLYGLPVYLDSTLAERPEMVFPGGSHHEEVRMPMHEYLRIERPIVSVAVTPHAA